jgi:hypothetical protein
MNFACKFAAQEYLMAIVTSPLTICGLVVILGLAIYSWMNP